MQSTKRNSNGKENETNKDMQHDLKLCGKNGKIHEAGVALTEDPEAATTIRAKENLQQCKHCGRNDHQQKSNALCPFFQSKVHYTSTGWYAYGSRYITGKHPPKRYICIKCGQHRFAMMPCRSCQSNGGK